MYNIYIDKVKKTITRKSEIDQNELTLMLLIGVRIGVKVDDGAMSFHQLFFEKIILCTPMKSSCMMVGNAEPCKVAKVVGYCYK